MGARSWLITGCSTGFGRSLAEAVLARGDNAVVTARKPATLANLVERYPATARAIELDVTRCSDAVAAVALAEEAFGRLDVLVNAAGYALLGAIEEAAPEEYRALFETNVFGVIETTRAALPALRRRRGSRIVNFSSVGGLVATAGFGIYNATKFAVDGLSEALALEVAPLGISVIIVQPGAFRTSVMSGMAASRTQLAAYEAIVGPSRVYRDSAHGNQPGDPERGVAVLLRAVDAENPPLRLALGADAYRRIRAKLDQLAGEMSEWEQLAANTDFAN